MARRIALATVYTLFVAALLLTWPLWSPLPEPGPDDLLFGKPTAISEVPLARLLVILVPFYWGWVAFHLKGKGARNVALVGAVIFFVVCLLFIESQDTAGPFCLWDDGHCGSRWFN